LPNAFVYKGSRGIPAHLGRDGERAVGRTLERLVADGYHVFHDIVGPNWNIDHLMIGPGGIFTIETKTRSKLERGHAVIRYRAEQVRNRRK
jgi:hypothetical protein